MSQPSAIDLRELAGMLKEHRAKTGMSLRAVAAETGVPFATLSRVEAGKLPDLDTFRNIVEWLGVPPDRFFSTPRVREESVPDAVASILRGDHVLSEQAKRELADIFRQMYSNLARETRTVEVHLRAHRAFMPEVGNLLADVLQDIQNALLGEEE